MRPPQAVAAIPILSLDEPRLKELGSDSLCPVCLESLKLGDQVMTLPCHRVHTYHPPCIAPWLAQSNSCPVCREVRVWCVRA